MTPPLELPDVFQATQSAIEPAAAARADEPTRTDATARQERAWPTDLAEPLKGNSPRILRTLNVRLQRYIAAPAKWLPSLNAANGSRRQQRSERRVACVQLLRALIKYCDLASLRVGAPGAQGWVDLTLPFFAGQAGLQIRRAERALRDLQTAGLAKVRRQCERQETDQGERYKGLAAIKYLPPSLFEAFGMGAWLRHERVRAHLRAQRRSAAARKRDRRAALEMNQLRTIAGSAGGRKRSSKERIAVADADFERMIMLRAGQIKARQPGLDREACYEQARRELAPPCRT
ncbi:Crp/Fnr family transcriptional regulator [Burkholderia vietnamiensis]|uniref:Crp/Fnr family transcriptional regulator n=1 Tax=Burkholderia vietnamiensis TaxID=60552 RepID=UPI001588388A|nr:Crp/Fnr family transcriptional regulator [Burkholderia vietnamiensis]